MATPKTDEELLREADELNALYCDAARWDAERHAAWVRSLDGKCADCGDPAPEHEPLCVPCWEAQP